MHRYVKRGGDCGEVKIKQEEQLMFKTHLLQYVREKNISILFSNVLFC